MRVAGSLLLSHLTLFVIVTLTGDGNGIRGGVLYCVVYWVEILCYYAYMPIECNISRKLRASIFLIHNNNNTCIIEPVYCCDYVNTCVIVYAIQVIVYANSHIHATNVFVITRREHITLCIVYIKKLHMCMQYSAMHTSHASNYETKKLLQTDTSDDRHHRECGNGNDRLCQLHGETCVPIGEGKLVFGAKEWQNRGSTCTRASVREIQCNRASISGGVGAIVLATLEV